VEFSLRFVLYYRTEFIERTAVVMFEADSDTVIASKTISYASDADLEMASPTSKNELVKVIMAFLTLVSPFHPLEIVIDAVMTSQKLICHLKDSAFSISCGAGLSVDDHFCPCIESVAVPVAASTSLPSQPAEIAELSSTNASGCDQ
jgi:hypothetical protein